MNGILTLWNVKKCSFFLENVFRCPHNLAPSYLSELLKLYAPKRENLQSSDKLFLDYSIPSTKYGEHAFSVWGSVLWNSLPDDIRLLDDIGSFKIQVKDMVIQWCL